MALVGLEVCEGVSAAMRVCARKTAFRYIYCFCFSQRRTEQLETHEFTHDAGFLPTSLGLVTLSTDSVYGGDGRSGTASAPVVWIYRESTADRWRIGRDTRQLEDCDKQAASSQN